MDILVIKSKTGEICIEKIQPTYNKFETSIDPIIPILNEHTSLKLYKVGQLKVCIEPPDGHGGGDVWEVKKDSRINQLCNMKEKHSFDSEALSQIDRINKELQDCNNYSYVVPIQKSKDSKWEFLQIPAFELNDNLYERYLLHHLKSCDVVCNIFHNVQSYTISQIEKIDLLKEVDLSALLNLMPKISLEDACRHIPLSEVTPILDVIKLNENNTLKYIKAPDTPTENSTALNNLSIIDQYNNLKSQNNADGSVLLMQCGKFYNAFGADAEKISKIAKVKLFSRKPENIPMIGIPVDNFELKYKDLITTTGLNVTVFKAFENNSFNEEKYHNIPDLSTNEKVLSYFKSIDYNLVEKIQLDGKIEVHGHKGGTCYLQDNIPNYLAELLSLATGHELPSEKIKERVPEINQDNDRIR